MSNLPVDVVITWVDTTDPKWQQRYEHALKQPFRRTARWSPERCPPDTELAMCLKLIRRNVTWVRSVYIVTQQQDPPCRTENEILVDHAALGLGHVFNSHAIEASLHRIPGLAEHFLYYNDDFYTVRPLTRSQFFGDDGDTIVRFTLWKNNTAFSKANVRTLQLYGEKNDSICMTHLPYPLTKTQMAAAEFLLPRQWDDTRASPLRYYNEKEIAPVLATSIHAVHTKRARRDTSGSFKTAFFYHEVLAYRYYLKSPHIICLNDFNGTEKDLTDAIEKRDVTLVVVLIIYGLIVSFLCLRRLVCKQTI